MMGKGRMGIQCMPNAWKPDIILYLHILKNFIVDIPPSIESNIADKTELS